MVAKLNLMAVFWGVFQFILGHGFKTTLNKRSKLPLRIKYEPYDVSHNNNW